ncbi:hypothetical protein D0466_11095 [Peribacillus glennii]|uniref:Polysaccharide chain length determinant N-terminal domain-containing protein n=2 Tax=Peribacillus glennii TaxID=2303991 RepID=A0A372LD87_9BACI|nr:hypothetical protein D0466_11095 [Peribacillus glennii]
MEPIFQRLLARFKKYFLVLIATPLILGALGWFLPIGKQGPAQPAETTISLGSYENPDLNEPKRVRVLLTNILFYQEHLPELWKEKGEELLADLNVQPVTDEIIELSFKNNGTEESVRTVNEITEAFLELDQERFQQKKDVIQKSIQAIEPEKVAPEAKVDQQRFLYELNTAELNLKPASLLQGADFQMDESGALNSKSRAILGVLIGITIAFFGIAIPEFVRERP